MSPLIGMTQRVVIEPRTGERRDALDQRWAAFLSGCGLTLVPMPNHPASALALADALPLAGLVLSGGNDLAVLGGDAPERDETERQLVDWAGTSSLPVLGVCRGAQHLAHLGGGRLERVSGHAGTRHAVRPHGREVNSYHDWAITQAPPTADITACAPDGGIEAFRLGYWTVIMWHPEREPVAHPDDLALFRSLFGDSP